jgi:hypothetical protein
LREIRSTQEPMSMERTEVLDMMGALKLFGMRGAYDETLATAIKRKHEPQRLVGDLLKAEISEKQARSIRYQMTIAKLPLAKDVDDFAFEEHRSTRDWSVTSPAGPSLPNSATSCWSAAPEPARRIWRSPSREAASGPARAVASSTPSTW